MFTASDITRWMEESPVIPLDQLTERDVINAREADDIYVSWSYEGKRSPIDRYWGNPQPDADALKALRRGFEVYSQYSVRATSRNTIEPDTLPNAAISTEVNSGYIAMSPAYRTIGLYPRVERFVIR